MTYDRFATKVLSQKINNTPHPHPQHTDRYIDLYNKDHDPFRYFHSNKNTTFLAPRYLPDRVTDLQMTESDYNGTVSLTWTASGNELDTGTGKHLTMFIIIY